MTMKPLHEAPHLPPGGLPSDEQMQQTLLDALAAAGVEVGSYDLQIVNWLARMDWTAFSTIVSWLERAAQR
ncbi:hypothetical protein GCM10027294_54080 [Marinactinospora endophytica]